MQFSRHARRRCRLYNVTQKEVDAAFPEAERVGTDNQGRPLYDMQIRHIRIRAVVALDRPDLIVTLFERKP